MITAQDIREKTFEKAFNGYNMAQVDDFLDQVAADLATLTKEAATMRSKMRVLVEKVEEYRHNEDSIRLALLSAQQTGNQIESEAQSRADSIVADARESAERITRRATDGIANEEAKLAEAKKATTKFFEHMRIVCEKQIEFYEKLSRMALVGGDDAPAARAEEPAPAPAPAPAAAPVYAPAPVSAPVSVSAPAPEPEPEPEEAPLTDREREMNETVKSIEDTIEKAALEEPDEPLIVDTSIPAEEEEPTRRFGEDSALRKKRSFDDFRFDDDI